jgi:HD-like signal output (HDOD) protein
VYDSPCMRPLWRHALESADTAAYLALRTQFLSAPEAALAGLVHDIGALAISLLDRGATSACNRLRAAGCPPTVAEWIVCGFDHAEAGAVVLETWGFPTDLVQAVRHHHAPEKSDTALAAMLYLVEFWTCGDEDLPSAVRLDLAAQRLDLSRQAVYALRPAKLLSRCDALTS